MTKQAYLTVIYGATEAKQEMVRKAVIVFFYKEKKCFTLWTTNNELLINLNSVNEREQIKTKYFTNKPGAAILP